MTSDTHAAGPVDQGEWLQTRPGERCLIRVAAAKTNGAYSVVEILAHPGDSTPMHVHQNEDEHFLILEGTARIVCDNETFDAPAGTAVTLPRLIPHAWGNASHSTLRMVVTCWPGGCEAILPLIARGGDIDLKSLGAKFGVRRVGPPLLEDRRSGLVRRLVLAKTDPAKQRIRAWLSDIDDERLFCLGLTSEDMAALRGTAAAATIAKGLDAPSEDSGASRTMVGRACPYLHRLLTERAPSPTLILANQADRVDHRDTAVTD